MSKNLPTFVPMSGGNLFATSQYLSALSSYCAEDWRLYLLQRDYFSNEWDIEGDDYIKQLWPLICGFCCDLGQVGLMKLNDKFWVVGLSYLETDQDMSIREGRGYILYNMWNYNKDSLKTELKLTKENCVLLRFNSWALPLFWTAMPIIDTMKLYLSANKTNAVTSIAKKIKISVQNDNSEIVMREIHNMLDPSNPYVINVVNPQSYFGNHSSASGLSTLDNSQNLALPNKIERMDLSEGAGNLLEGWDAFAAALGFWYSHMGRIENVNEKSERLIVGENNNSNSNIKIVSNERHKYMKLFVEQANKTFGIKLKLKPVAEVQTESSGNKENKEVPNVDTSPNI